MSSATVQAKIIAFESLAGASSSAVTESLLEAPISPTTANALPPVAQFTSRNASKPSPPNLGQKTSLIDLRDWVVEDEFSHSQPPSVPARNGIHNGNLSEYPPKVKPKPKHLVSKPVALAGDARNSLRSVASTSSLRSSSTSYSDSNVDRGHTYPPPMLNVNLRSAHAPTSSISSLHSVSLSSDTDPSTSSSSQHTASLPIEKGKDRDLSVKSYGSDTVSLDESYEEVSSTFVGSPATERLINLDWERAPAQWKIQSPGFSHRPPAGPTTTKPPVLRPLPPKVPPRSTSTFAVTSPVSRRAPLPPSRSSDRSSVLSSATSDSAFSVNYATYQSNHTKVPSQIPTVQINSINLIQKTRRPTPIPPKARKRYEDLFDANVIQRRKAEKRRKDMPGLLTPQEARRSRRAVGWRGLSIDLTTAGGHPVGEEEVDQVVGNDEVIQGRIIHSIWTRSGLDKKKLRVIWNECDLTKTGVLDREAFVKGMWKIDEELRRVRR